MTMRAFLLPVSLASAILSAQDAWVRAADVPIGGVCSDNDDCESQFCSGQTCVCRFYDHFPCEPGQVCNGSKCIDVGPDSVELGGLCRETSQCLVGVCLQLFGGSACVCDSETNEGCSDQEVCSSWKSLPDASPQCLTPTGGQCSASSDCMSFNCVAGACAECSVLTNEGCDFGEICIGDDASGYECVNPEKAELGGPCKLDSDCESDVCIDGMCVCRGMDHFGCTTSQICDGTACIDIKPTSVEPGGVCRNTSQCKIGECVPLLFGAACACSVSTNDGCDEDSVCAFVPLLEDAPPTCLVPPGGQCSTESDCLSRNCVSGKCAACNVELNIGCQVNEMCTGDELSGYVCVALDTPPVCMLSMQCCVEDCCGVGTRWNSSVDRCVPDEMSQGWTGKHSDEYVLGCDHVCCEGMCCGEGTYFDEVDAYCRAVVF